MFTVVDETTAKEIEASARVRGAVDAFLKNLGEFYDTWSKDNEGTFLIQLNGVDGSPFEGKKTDSLYTSIGSRINKLELKQVWRLIRKDDNLYIVHL
jgi:hypothetical protein